ncbi:TrmH family RNA methyltransferase [Isachenkonia alkalipeptolytica]|uniref:TrmH family RNA methyltransferase n=1 Tax=Isachenkonia alkalipeptolytica TaxID=2565777 RepID=UPI0013703647|nr:RNA methyltransferase [Isachenkonia alkalipeptolytica]
MKDIIESLDNPKIKEIRSLHKKKYRKKFGKYLIEGKRIVAEALEHGAKIDSIIISSDYIGDETYQESVLNSGIRNIELIRVTEKVFLSIAKTESPQGIIAVIHKEEHSLEKSLGKLPKYPYIVTLENLQDPGNMGTIIRTAEAAGVDLILVTKNSTDPYGDKALRSSMGAIFHVPIVEVEGMEWLSLLKINKIQVIATDLSATKTYGELDYRGGINLIIGNEGHGISKNLLDQADEKIIIPIYGNIDSLNASVASGILLYKAREKRGIV